VAREAIICFFSRTGLLADEAVTTWAGMVQHACLVITLLCSWELGAGAAAAGGTVLCSHDFGIQTAVAAPARRTQGQIVASFMAIIGSTRSSFSLS